MTRKEDRSERGKQRSEEYRHRSRMRLTLFSIALMFYVAVPLLWYGAVEFGFVPPIRTPEFKSALNSASLVLLFVILFFLPEVWRRRKDLEQSEDSVTSTPTANEQHMA